MTDETPPIMSDDELDALLLDAIEEAPAVAEPAPAAAPAAAAPKPAAQPRPASKANHVHQVSPEAQRVIETIMQRKVVRDRLPALETIHDRLAKSARMELSALTRKTCDVTVKSMEWMSFEAYLETLPKPVSFNSFFIKPLSGTGLLAIHPGTILATLDFIYGGNGVIPSDISHRDFNRFETSVIGMLVEPTLFRYGRAWSSSREVETELLKSDSNPKFTNLTMSPQDMVSVTTFEVDILRTRSYFNIVLPYSMLEPIKRSLNEHSMDINPEEEEEWKRKFQEELKATNVEISANLLKIDTTLEELANLQVGQEFFIDFPSRVIAEAAGVPVMSCLYGNVGKSKALQVDKIYDHSALLKIAKDLI
ncbi:flagellar motor switch protein FliM [Pseudomonas nitritireducens]|uniref:Flagellar motor switch protein FliM n=1 Tax=Pseudomonas nitroreducens TaxID=46680 RepID=A0A7W7NYB4_PSENT|nr:flagellar motor switch protein FliM [Pseudomonas nitritireducens]MBB4861276.1 flagellar motor switch protein FliM [Pseudomonas nitritireducens]